LNGIVKAGDTVIYVIYINPSYDLLLKSNWDKAYSCVPKEKCSNFLKISCYRFRCISDIALLCKPYKIVFKKPSIFSFPERSMYLREQTNYCHILNCMNRLSV
jgi:hypothetical protein